MIRLIQPNMIRRAMAINIGAGRVLSSGFASAANPLWSRDLTDASGLDDGTFTRSTTAYGIDDAGVWTSYAIDAPRTNSRGLLMEPALTNNALQSLPSGWSATPVSGTGSSAVAAGITGTNTARAFTDTDAAVRTVYRQTCTGAADTSSFVAWINQDAVTSRVCAFGGLQTGGTTTTALVQVDTVTGQTYVITQTNCTATARTTIEDGLIKLEIRKTQSPLSNTGSRTDFYPAYALALAGGHVTATGSATLAYTGIFQNAAEAANVHLQSPIPTTTALVARAADSLIYTGVPASNKTRIATSAGYISITDWDGTIPAVTAPIYISRIDVYAP